MKDKEIEDLFIAFNNKKVLIVGDCMIDEYIWGEINRISPEAPVITTFLFLKFSISYMSN